MNIVWNNITAKTYLFVEYFVFVLSFSTFFSYKTILVLLIHLLTKQGMVSQQYYFPFFLLSILFSFVFLLRGLRSDWFFFLLLLFIYFFLRVRHSYLWCLGVCYSIGYAIYTALLLLIVGCYIHLSIPSISECDPRWDLVFYRKKVNNSPGYIDEYIFTQSRWCSIKIDRRHIYCV